MGIKGCWTCRGDYNHNSTIKLEHKLTSARQNAKSSVTHYGQPVATASKHDVCAKAMAFSFPGHGTETRNGL
jgi:hypothetical protein